MSGKKRATGGCLCGAVRITGNSISESVGACHCGQCRGWSGGPLLAIEAGTDVSFEGEEHIGLFVSSEWAERGFCKTCGTHLFYRLKETQEYHIPVGVFGDETFTFDLQIFTDRKPDYYQFANHTKRMTGEEVFAAFADQSK